MVPTDTQLADMGAQLDRLRSAYNQASADVNGSSLGAWLLGNLPSRDAQNTALAAANENIGLLASTLWNEVLSGIRSYNDWSVQASATFKDISDIDKDVGNWNFGGVVTAAASATVSDVKTDLLWTSAILTPLLLLAGGLYLFVLTRRA